MWFINFSFSCLGAPHGRIHPKVREAACCFLRMKFGDSVLGQITLQAERWGDVWPMWGPRLIVVSWGR